MQSKLLLRRQLLLAGTSLLSLALLPQPLRAQSTRLKIGFIGAGRIGGGLAKLWAAAGYSVMLSARDLGPVRELAAQIGPNAQVGTPAAIMRVSSRARSCSTPATLSLRATVT